MCVRKAKGDEAFFKYAQAVFDTQEALTADGGDQTLANAVTKAGGDGVAMAACAKTAGIVDAVKAQMQLGLDAGVDSTPTLFINGFAVPVSGMCRMSC